MCAFNLVGLGDPINPIEGSWRFGGQFYEHCSFRYENLIDLIDGIHHR
jgi:hypothetical protein